MGGIVTGSSGGALRGSQALRFFQTHQIRVCFCCETDIYYDFFPSILKKLPSWMEIRMFGK